MRPINTNPDAPPTSRQLAVLRYIAEFTAKHGYCPGYREIRDNFGFKQLNSVHTYLAYLQAKSLITRTPYVSRSIVLTEKGKDVLRQERGPVVAR